MTASSISKPIARGAVGARVSHADQAPPAATAPFDEREAWCMDYTEWFLAHSPDAGTPPADVRASQHFENEFNSCKLDPQEYERLTRTEVVPEATETPDR